MISMSKAYSIRQLRMEGDSIAEISRKLEVSRDTVYKYLAMEDLSQRPPAPRAKASVLDRYRPLIESWLDEDERNWRKQRHTARRIWARLRDEAGADVAESTVRNYVTNPGRPTRRRLWSRGCDGFASSRSCRASPAAFGAGSRCRLLPRSAARGAGPRRSSLLSRRKNKITCRNAPTR